jgi:hypothetical protein
MALSTHQQLAHALESAQKVAVQHIVQSSHLAPAELKLLVAQGFLKKIIRGWYLLDADHTAIQTGDSVLWQESYRAFLGQYLFHHFGKNYHLSPEDSLDIHTGATSFSKGVIVYVDANTRRKQELPANMVLQTLKKPEKYNTCEPIASEGLNILSLSDSLVSVVPNWYRKHPLEAELALSAVDIQDVARSAVSIANLSAVGRIIGAYQAMGANDHAEYLQNIMLQAGFEKIKYDISNPFENIKLNFNEQAFPVSPYAGRIQALWNTMREDVVKIFSSPPKKVVPIDKLLEKIDDLYVHDAYHSLSIEGYRVTSELIMKIKSGNWDPEHNQKDKKMIDALAAKGYALAFAEVKKTIAQLTKDNDKTVLGKQVSQWYAALFNPCVQAGIVSVKDIAGYRNRPVYIRGSRHVPLPHHALRDVMHAFYAELAQESHPAVCAVLGHFLIGFIHPYPDGNGRIARFMMNTLFSVAGYPWTIIRVEDRQEYMTSLEKASCEGNIKPFAKFILKAMSQKF